MTKELIDIELQGKTLDDLILEIDGITYYHDRNRLTLYPTV